jgi:hypothetical protein
MLIFTICTAEQPLASLHELQTIYSVDDVLILYEMMQAKSALIDEARKEQERQNNT